MPKGARAAAQVDVAGVGWKRSISISAGKYEVIAQAILAVLGSEPIRLTELARRVGERLTDLQGSVSWHMVSVARELQRQCRLVRHTEPVLYSRSQSKAAPRPLGRS